MASLFLRNLFFTILQPGMVAGLIPFWILGDEIKSAFTRPLKFYHYLGAAAFVLGLVVMLMCIISFAVRGRGTLSPIDPTRKLVVEGLYRFSRNPMYVGVTLILIGEAIFFQSTTLWFYSFFIFAAFNTFVIRIEEPRLRKNFGEDYTDYCKKTRRWV